MYQAQAIYLKDCYLFYTLDGHIFVKFYFIILKEFRITFQIREWKYIVIITLFILSQNREVKFEQYLIYAEEFFDIDLLRILRDTYI